MPGLCEQWAANADLKSVTWPSPHDGERRSAEAVRAALFVTASERAAQSLWLWRPPPSLEHGCAATATSR